VLGRRQNKTKTNIRHQNYALFDRQEMTKTRSIKRSQNYLKYNELNYRNSTNSCSTSNPIETTSTSIRDNSKINKVDSVIHSNCMLKEFSMICCPPATISSLKDIKMNSVKSNPQ
jgi:hypothetical protein